MSSANDLHIAYNIVVPGTTMQRLGSTACQLLCSVTHWRSHGVSLPAYHICGNAGCQSRSPGEVGVRRQSFCAFKHAEAPKIQNWEVHLRLPRFKSLHQSSDHLPCCPRNWAAVSGSYWLLALPWPQGGQEIQASHKSSSLKALQQDMRACKTRFKIRRARCKFPLRNRRRVSPAIGSYATSGVLYHPFE
jgi:hypothetical protein